jgi:peptidyl-tRNA hydrolase
MYVLVRTDLPGPQITVQAAHASIEATKHYSFPAESCGQQNWVHPHLVVCGVENERKLLTEYEKLSKIGVKTKVFYEEDRNNEATALASEIVFGEDRKYFRKYKLLK